MIGPQIVYFGHGTTEEERFEPTTIAHGTWMWVNTGQVIRQPVQAKHMQYNNFVQDIHKYSKRMGITGGVQCHN